MSNKKKEPYILTCPFCGVKHSIDIDDSKSLLSSPDKIFSLQCACSFREDVGCNETIIICSLKTLKSIQK
jgi:hypothetical protein